MSDLEEQLHTLETLIKDKKALPERFCAFVAVLKTIPPTAPAIQTQVQTFLHDLNQQVEMYDEQYQVLLQELGTLCPANSTNQDLVSRFFEALLELFSLAMYNYNDPQPFADLLDQIASLLKTKTMQLKEDPFQKALLLQLTKSAWALTQSKEDMIQYASRLKHSSKSKTRKQRRS